MHFRSNPSARIASRMDMEPARVLLIGANSAIGCHIRSLLPDVRAIARSTNVPQVHAVGAYETLPRSLFDGIDTVINCVGLVSGPEADLRRVNGALQTSLATSAREAGVRRYVSIGSFSIFGPRERIDCASVPAPEDTYGRSKLEAEHVLRNLCTKSFATLSVVFPALIGTARPGKVERMLGLWSRLGAWPVPRVDVARSMIGVEAAARILIRAADDDCTGRVLAADPQPFSYGDAARWLHEDVGGRFARIAMPAAAAATLRRVAPGVHRSMMTDSLLDPASNYAARCGFQSSLRRELASSLLRQGARR